MKIVILSDLHANLEALGSITEPYDELWVLGDLVNYGPDPRAVIDFVRRHAALVVRGNHDHAIGTGSDPRCSPAFRGMAHAMQAYTESVLNGEEKAYLCSLPMTVRREADGRRFLLCHAAPSDPLFRYAPATTSFWETEADAAEVGVLLAGHTHLPFTLDLGGRLVVNPGSVGQPKHGAAEARYAVWDDGEVSLRSSPYPVENTVAKVRALPIDARIREELALVLMNGRPPL